MKIIEPDFDVVRRVAEEATGLQAVWSHFNVRRPKRPYITVNILSHTRVNTPSRTEINDDGELLIISDWDFSVSYQVAGDTANHNPRSAFNLARKLQNDLDKPSVQEKLRSQNIYVRGVEMVMDNPLELDGEWQPRATLDVMFGTAGAIKDNVGVIETVSVKGKVSEKEITFDNLEDQQ